MKRVRYPHKKEWHVHAGYTPNKKNIAVPALATEADNNTITESLKNEVILVIGAGNGAKYFIREVENQSVKVKCQIVGLIDDDPALVGHYRYDVPVLGNTNELAAIIDEYHVTRLILAIPSLTSKELDQLLQKIPKTVHLATIPSLEALLTGQSITTLHHIPISTKKLLHREEIILDESDTHDFLKEKVILVTGAGGSIGSEICRNLLRHQPNKLILVGHGENSIYTIYHELLKLKDEQQNTKIIPVIADIQDGFRIMDVMNQYKPAIVYHAGAHKHVPMMEVNPYEAVKNNVYGTKNVAEAALHSNVEKFIMISTDKAVNPTNTMGSTKRIAEMLVTNLNGVGKTKFSVVRFGNVLGSRGSVVPLFQKQIETGGPVTVTDFEMTRYFMTIPEASRLVIQAGTIAKGGEIYVLDMGKAVKIYDLAKRMIEELGYTVDEIKIVESGIRPGEKLYEELLVSKEYVEKQVYEKIFIGRVSGFTTNEIEKFLSQLPPFDEVRLKQELIQFAKDSLKVEGGISIHEV